MNAVSQDQKEQNVYLYTAVLQDSQMKTFKFNSRMYRCTRGHPWPHRTSKNCAYVTVFDLIFLPRKVFIRKSCRTLIEVVGAQLQIIVLHIVLKGRLEGARARVYSAAPIRPSQIDMHMFFLCGTMACSSFGQSLRSYCPRSILQCCFLLFRRS